MSEYSASSIDLLSLDQGYEPVRTSKLFNELFLYTTPNPAITRFEAVYRTLSGGLNQVLGVSTMDMDRLAASSLDDAVPGELVVPWKIKTETTIYQQNEAICFANVFGTMAVGAGSTANHCLLKETSATDPTPVEVTYTPGSKILSLTPTTGLGSTAEKLLVGRAGAAVHVLGDLATGGPTVYGTMHANTTNCWGIINTPINAASPGTGGLLIGANSNIYFLSKGAAVGDPPTVASTGIRNGGYAIGIINLPSIGVARAFWWIPDVDAGTATALAQGAQKKGHIFHTNLEGSDLQPLETSFIGGMLWVAKVNGGSMIATDGLRVTFIADREYDTGFGQEPQQGNMIDSTVYYAPQPGATVLPPATCGGFWVSPGSVYALSIAGSATMYYSKFNAKTMRWGNSSASIPANSTLEGIGGVAPFTTYIHCFPMGPLPFSFTTNYAHLFPLASSAPGRLAYRKYTKPDGASVFWQTDTGYPSEASGKAYTTAISLASNIRHGGVEGLPFVVEEIVYMGADSRKAANQTSPVTGSVKIAVGLEIAGSTGWDFATVIGTFNMVDQSSVHFQRFSGNNSASRRLALQITVTAATAGVFSPNALPFIIRGLIFHDRVVVSPSVAGPGVAWYSYV